MTPSITTFYVTVATLIPVLILAFAVQGSAYDDLLKAGLDMANGVRHQGHPLRKLVSGVMSWIMIFTAVFIVIAAGLGEITSIYVLYRGRQGGSDQRHVLNETIILVIAVLATPVLKYVRAMIRPRQPVQAAQPPPPLPALQTAADAAARQAAALQEASAAATQQAAALQAAAAQ